jgi:hypothetical protein
MTSFSGLSQEAKSFPIGYYEHYKKMLYKVIGVATHSETLEEVVVYQALYGDQLLWVRPLKMFTESVTVDGKTCPRFRYLGDTL